MKSFLFASVLTQRFPFGVIISLSLRRLHISGNSGLVVLNSYISYVWEKSF